MGFRNDYWAIIWEITPVEGKRVTKVRLSTSRKKPDGTYKQDFSGICDFLGDASDEVRKMNPKDRVKLVRTEVTTEYYKETNKEYIHYNVFEIAANMETPHTEASKPQSLDEGVEGDTEEELPF